MRQKKFKIYVTTNNVYTYIGLCHEKNCFDSVFPAQKIRSAGHLEGADHNINY